MVTVFVWQTCYSCCDYAAHRRNVLVPHMADKAIREGREAVDVVNEFMAAAHQRHMNGEPLRPGGPTRVTDPAIGRLAALRSAVSS